MYIYDMPTKKEIIETVYFRPEGSGSLKQVTRDAQLKDETVTFGTGSQKTNQVSTKVKIWHPRCTIECPWERQDQQHGALEP